MVLALGMLCGAWLVGSAPEIPEPVPGSVPATTPTKTPGPSAPPSGDEPATIDTVDIAAALDVRPGATCIENERLASCVVRFRNQPMVQK